MKNTKLLEKMLKYSVVASASLGVFSACGPGGANLSIMATGQSTYQGSTANNKVDVLWVIDNSGSMYTKQEKLGAGFASFATLFSAKDFNFNMAVVTTDIPAQDGNFQSLPYPYQHPIDTDRSVPFGYVGANGPAVTILTNSTPDLFNHFISNVRVGDTGAANARALDAIVSSTSTAKLAGLNAGFLREDAHLAVIIVTDDDDGDIDFGLGSTASTTDVISHLQTLKPDKFDVISRTYKKNFTVSAVMVDTDTTGCVAPFSPGVEFRGLVTETEGSIANICANDFSTGLSQISQRIAEAITEIPLSRAPDVSTIQILFNGSVVPQGATDGWTYSATGNKIVFHGNYIPRDNTSISVNYTPADIIR
jgi:hypothetical protein